VCLNREERYTKPAVALKGSVPAAYGSHAGGVGRACPRRMLIGCRRRGEPGPVACRSGIRRPPPRGPSVIIHPYLFCCWIFFSYFASSTYLLGRPRLAQDLTCHHPCAFPSRLPPLPPRDPSSSRRSRATPSSCRPPRVSLPSKASIPHPLHRLRHHLLLHLHCCPPPPLLLPLL
jgi:hypothetical protein